ncbi:MAG: GMC family oxidoreductase [Polyangiaceae bacterium]|nr:GMC family oxidoreductase [Polyangiaceae bacterium]
MIFDSSRLKLPLRIKADLCVVGSGAGGAMAAMTAAEAGLSVVVLEAGAYLTPADMVQREEVMFPKLYWEAGGRTTADRGVKIHQGRGVGGSTLHNLNLCKRIPNHMLSAWAAERKLEHLTPEVWAALYTEVESMLEVSRVPEDLWNRHNQLLAAGCKQLGWKGGGLEHNRTGCVGSGFCEVGCAYDAKNNAAKVLLPRLIKAGGEVLSHCQAVRVEHEKGRVTGVSAHALNPSTHEPVGEVLVNAPAVCLAGSATATPAILLRSNVPCPPQSTGDSLRIHPALVAAGEFDEPVYAWRGIPQTYECTEWLQLDKEGGHRSWIVPAFAHPVGTATLLPGHGSTHQLFMRRYSHLAALTAMIHDESKGTVRPKGPLGLSIDYWPNESDRRELLFGLWASARLLQAAGARRVVIPSTPLRVFEKNDSLDPILDLPLERGLIDITAVHPMASVPMGDNRTQAAVDSQGRHHHVGGLWVADGSLFPSSIGGPPQLSIYALGRHVGRAIAADTKR